MCCGFMRRFAATVVGPPQHPALGRLAPWAFADLPKVRGSDGGLMLAVGRIGHWRLHLRRHPPARRRR
jgi:hypothetical protein